MLLPWFLLSLAVVVLSGAWLVFGSHHHYHVRVCWPRWRRKAYDVTAGVMQGACVLALLVASILFVWAAILGFSR